MERTKHGYFAKGNQIAAGNDKTARLSVFLEKAIREAHTLDEYEQARTKAQAMADDFVDSYWKATTIAEKKAVLDTIADRTEGKPKQSTDITSSDGSIGPLSGLSREQLAALLDKAKLSTGEEKDK